MFVELYNQPILRKFSAEDKADIVGACLHKLARATKGNCDKCTDAYKFFVLRSAMMDWIRKRNITHGANCFIDSYIHREQNTLTNSNVSIVGDDWVDVLQANNSYHTGIKNEDIVENVLGEIVNRDICERMSKELPKEFSDILNLWFFQNLSYVDIAEELQIPLGTVKSRLSHAKRALTNTSIPGYLCEINTC